MLRIRLFEEKLDYLFKRGQLGGTVHLCIGQEACAVGVCAALDPGDVVSGTHRGHGHAIAKGLKLDRMFAELMGRVDGYCKGKGGTQHLASLVDGFLGTNGITGGGIPISTGAAMAMKVRKLPNVAVAFFGDGAVNQGAFHEALNFGSIWQLPVIYVCENNLYAMSAHIDQMLGASGILERAQAYQIEGVRVDGMDVLAVYEAASKARQFVAGQQRPYFIECTTYRYFGHSKSDGRRYRTREEEAEWKERDPINAFSTYLREAGLCTESEIATIRKEVESEVEAGVEFARQSAEGGPVDVLTDVYANE
jgi:TPP-dependent pyruvate/acetoin dehydrogenase alpha subunit